MNEIFLIKSAFIIILCKDVSQAHQIMKFKVMDMFCSSLAKSHL
jgi:hypothetical protein